MTGRFDEIRLEGVRTVSVAERGSTVSVEDFGTPVKGGKAFRRWLDSLPDQQAARRLRHLAAAMRRARSARGREIIWMIGAHVIKCGLPPYLIEMMKKGYLTALAMNGAGLIHDTEIAFFGRTSEDVAGNLERGVFGFGAETASIIFEAVEAGRREGMGLGEAIGSAVMNADAPHRGMSLLGQALRLGIPATVHAAIGTDIVVQHPGFDGAAWGELSARDFRIFAERVRSLGTGGGVAVNAGSAVILPEVFLKAVSVARNLGAPFDSITTCDLDMSRHYRPETNVLRRPTAFGGEAIPLTGHHEIMIPLIFSALFS